MVTPCRSAMLFIRQLLFLEGPLQRQTAALGTNLHTCLHPSFSSIVIPFSAFKPILLISFCYSRSFSKYPYNPRRYITLQPTSQLYTDTLLSKGSLSRSIEYYQRSAV